MRKLTKKTANKKKQKYTYKKFKKHLADLIKSYIISPVKHLNTKIKTRSCNELKSILDYIDDILEGKYVKPPKVSKSQHKYILNYFNKLLSNEKDNANISRELLGIVSELS